MIRLIRNLLLGGKKKAPPLPPVVEVIWNE
jgi:hypothetical protein